jgi:predicted phage tail protein
MNAIVNPNDLLRHVVRGAGGGGGGKGGGGSATTEDDTLRSSTKVYIVEALGEGPIVGLVNGANSIYFDDTPLENADGAKNFVGVTWDQRPGLPDQTPITDSGPAQTSTPFSVETQVKKSVPAIRTIDDPNAATVQVIIRLPALVKADQNTGDVTGTSVNYRIDRRAAGGNWETMADVVVNGKVSSPYNKAHVIPAPANRESPWDIRVSRLTDDPDPVEATLLQNQTWWQSYSTIISSKFSYNDTALVALAVDAFLFGSNIGTRGYHVRGLIIDVPSNYNPLTKTYSGVWDGTFKAAWTSNPAWIFYDLITNNRYGLGEFVNAALIDKWSLYQIGQYCDQLVPSGFKDANGNDIMEPRFAFNGVIKNREEAYTVLQNITAAFRGMAYWSLGQVFCAADIPSDPVAAFTPANVIDGHFKYSGTAMKARHSVAVVSWQDPNNYFRDTPEVIQDDDMIERFGWRQTDVSLMGCTSRGQAHRFGKWILDTERNQTETVQFAISWDGYVLKENQQVKPGDIVLVSDPRKNGNYRAGGRLLAVGDASHVTLDFPFEPQAGQTYTLSSMLPDGSFETKTIASFGDDNATITLASAFSAPPVLNADWIIQSANMVARQYRVMAVQEDAANIFKITALIHDPNKYARVEQNLALDKIPYVRPRNVIAAVTNLQATEAHYFQNGVSHSRVTLSWTGPNDFQVADYLITADSPHGFVNFNSVTQPSLDITDATSGDWTFHVVTRSLTGATSTPVSLQFTVEGWEAVDGPLPSALVSTDGAGVFNGRAPTVTWTNTFPPGAVVYQVKNVVRVYDGASDLLLRTETVQSTTYTYSYEANVNDGGPRRHLRIDVTALSVTGTESAPASIVIANPPPAAPTIQVKSGVGSLEVAWSANDPDYAGALVWASTSAGFVPTLDNFLYDGPDTKANLVIGAGNYYVWVANYDAFGKIGLNVGGPQTVAINDLNSTLAGVLPDLLSAAGQVTVKDVEDIGDQLAGIVNQIIQDRDWNDQLHARHEQSLSVKSDGLSSMIIEEQTARIEANFAEATARQVLEANINDNVIAQIANESLARATADEALSTQVTALTAQVNDDIAAALQTEQTARADADSALAQSISTVSTTVSGHTASLSTIQSSVDGVKLEYGVIGTIDDATGGFLMTGIKQLDGSVSFTMKMSGDLIVQNSISTDKLSVNFLSAYTGTFGTLTAGILKSTDNKVVLDLTAKTFIISD